MPALRILGLWLVAMLAAGRLAAADGATAADAADAASGDGPVKVAALHPLLADLARQVGGPHVEVVDLLGPAGDAHRFEPTPEVLKAAEGARLYLASGMGLEGYLGGLRDITAGKARVVEVGASLPALEGACEDHDHGPHQHGLDPHWWHSPDAMRRAASVVAEALAVAAPGHADEFRARAEGVRDRLSELERWARRELAKVPVEQRWLATAHDAFGYFCRDFGFRAIPLQGLNREQQGAPAQLAEVIATIRARRLRAVFPEQGSNPKVLEVLVRDTGVRLAEPLDADGVRSGSYEAMLRGNVRRIVAALAP